MSDLLRRKETQAIWFKRMEDWRKSGLSQAEYCRQHTLKSSNFYNWSTKYRHHRLGGTHSPENQDKSTPEFIPVTVQPASSEFTISCGDVSLHFTPGLTPQSLAPWIKALRAGVC